MADTVEVPIHILRDGREFIAAEDCIDRPEVQAFVDRFPDYWQDAGLHLHGYVGPSPEVRKALYG